MTQEIYRVKSVENERRIHLTATFPDGTTEKKCVPAAPLRMIEMVHAKVLGIIVFEIRVDHMLIVRSADYKEANEMYEQITNWAYNGDAQVLELTCEADRVTPATEVSE